MASKLFGAQHLVKACDYSWRGLMFTWLNETAFQQESLVF